METEGKELTENMQSQPEKVVSPEIAEKKLQSRSFLMRALSYYADPFIHCLSAARLYFLGRSHKSEGEFEWNWSSTNFNRIAITNLLVSKVLDANYLEIGCANNALFDSVSTRRKTGVDPSSGGTVRDTSDNFFAKNTETFDVVFIDGLHTYTQVTKDVINSIRATNKNGYILLHDMLPSNWFEASVPPVAKGAWTGDVWKVAFELIQSPGLEFKIIAVDHGVGVIKVQDQSAVLANLETELSVAQFSFLKGNIEKLPITTVEQAWSWLKS